MEIVVLGSGTSLPYARRSAPGYAIRPTGGEWLLFDAGSGALRRAAEAGIEPHRLAHLFLTHYHLDHVSDLMPLLFAKRHPGLRGNADLAVHGPAGLARLREGLRAAHGSVVDGKGFAVTWDEIEAAPASRPVLRGEGFTVSALAVAHGEAPATGYRIEEEANARAIAYSGDSGPCDALVELGRLADLFVIECSAPDRRPVEGHLTPAEVGRIGREAKARRLLLTHISPEMDALDLVGGVARHFTGDIVVAEDLMRIKI